MKRLEKMNNGLAKVSAWFAVLTFVLTAWMIAVKCFDLSFMMKLGEEYITVTSQMLVSEAFCGIIGLIAGILVCALLYRITKGLMKIKRRKMQRV